MSHAVCPTGVELESRGFEAVVNDAEIGKPFYSNECHDY